MWSCVWMQEVEAVVDGRSQHHYVAADDGPHKEAQGDEEGLLGVSLWYHTKNVTINGRTKIIDIARGITRCMWQQAGQQPELMGDGTKKITSSVHGLKHAVLQRRNSLRG